MYKHDRLSLGSCVIRKSNVLYTRSPRHVKLDRLRTDRRNDILTVKSQFKVTTHTKTIRVPPRLPISRYTAVLRSALNATRSHRPSPCGILALTVISVGQHPFVACLSNIQYRNSPDVALLESSGKFTTSFRTVSTQFHHRHVNIGARVRILIMFHHSLVRIPPSRSAYVQSRSPTQHPPGLEGCRYARSQGYL